MSGAGSGRGVVVGHRESPRARGCFGSVLALPLAVIGIGGVLALVFLRGEPPARQAGDQFVEATSQPTMVSAFWSHAVAPTSSKSFVLEAMQEARAEVLHAVRSGPGSTAGEVSATTSAAPSSAEERGRRAGDPRTHRHRPSSSAPLPTADPSGAVLNPSTSASAGTPSSSTPVDPVQTPVETGSASSSNPPPPPPPPLSSEASVSASTTG